MAPMTFGSLFAGIGGFDLGLERAGMECKWQVEIDDFCNRVLEKHWPRVKRYRDVREVGAHNLEPVDLICGGFPCQPFSVAGKQRGKEDDRHLWPEMFRIVSELRPTWVVGENVPGLVRLGLDEVLSDLEGIGYSTQTFDIPACAVDAPHVRHRIWIVAFAGRERLEEPRVFGADQFGRSGAIREGQAGARVHEDVADPCRPRGGRRDNSIISREEVAYRGKDVADADRTGRGEQCGAESIQSELAAAECGSRWLPEPRLGRRSDGFPAWLEQHCGGGISYAESQRSVKALRELWNPDVSAALRKAVGGLERIQQAEVLFSFVREHEKGSDEARLLMEGKEVSENFLRGLRGEKATSCPPCKSGQGREHAGKHPDLVQVVSQLPSFNGEEAWPNYGWEDGIPRVAKGIERRVDRLRALGNAVVPQVVEIIGRAIMEVENGN